MPDLLIPSSNGRIPAWFAAPDTPNLLPGVVVLHDINGMSSDLRNQANWLAEAGFMALAPNLYHRGVKLLCIRHVIRDLISRTGSAFNDVEACRAWLLAQPNSKGKAGVIGFCMGGGFALLLASGHGFSAASVNYGGPLPKDVDSFLETACPLVVSYGGLAKWEKGVAAQLEEKLERALIPHDTMEYPDAGHAFMNNHGGLSFLKILRIKAIGYNEAATIDARRRIIAFFKTHLKDRTESN